ncbi:hypothetical protein [Thalassorhabdomicrobium marinisediminis]|uniref:hypothetical protein n=1 Tax=Thalassorhabdomicrobium marinisediminis TaxID=2170577 RepID=UPI002491A090|nr:hypothetical protein [Thalassorhabdomicrobium marinisediminis]
MGASILLRDGQVAGLHSHPGVIGVAHLADVGPTFLTRAGAYALSGDRLTCGTFAPSLAALPEPWRIERALVRDIERVHLYVSDGDDRVQGTLLCDLPDIRLMSDRIDVPQRTRHIADLRPQQEATRDIGIRVTPSDQVTTNGGHGISPRKVLYVSNSHETAWNSAL